MAVESPFGKFFQLGYVTRDIDAAAHRMMSDLGACQLDLIHELRDENGDEVFLKHLAHFALGGIEAELIEPRLDWPSLYLEALPAQPDAFALHHLGYLVADEWAFDRALQHAAATGASVAFSADTANVRLAYIDTRRTSGHYSEVVLSRVPRYDTSVHGLTPN
jgi:catechol 2,3-dioxygenase-like lactoylglutathione lyase family enzyme